MPAANFHGSSLLDLVRRDAALRHHVAAVQTGAHGLQQIPSSIQHADAERGEQFVTGERHEVDVQI